MQWIEITDEAYKLMEELRANLENDEATFSNVIITQDELIMNIIRKLSDENRRLAVQVKDLGLQKKISVVADPTSLIPTLVVSPEEYAVIKRGTTAHISYDYDAKANFDGKPLGEIKFEVTRDQS